MCQQKGVLIYGTHKKLPQCVRKRPNGTWEGRYTAGTDERTGKSIRRSVYGKTQKEVRERLRQITNDIDTGSYVAPCSMKYSEWIDIWLSEYLTGRSPLTISQYKSYAHNHIVPVLGNHRLDELSLAQIQKFIKFVRQDRKEYLRHHAPLFAAGRNARLSAA